MSVSYGTITITDTNDIESIVVEYNRNQNPSSAPAENDSNWSTNRPAWAEGYYIWQRTRTHKAGTLAINDIFGTAVCVTGSTGQTGGTGAAGRSLTSTVTQYTTANSSATIDESTMNNYTWNNNVPTYSSSTPAYWVRVTNTYSNPSSTEYIIYKDNGLTDAIKTSHDANTTAQSADSKADQAISDASSALTQIGNVNTALNNYKTANDTAVNALKAQATHYWWDSEGAHVASGVSPMASNNLTQGTPSTYGFNALMAPGSLALRQKNINLAQLATNALTFYIPPNSSTTQGPKALEVGTNGLIIYNPVANNNAKSLEVGSGSIKIYNPDISNNVALMQLNGQNIEFLNLVGTVQAKFGTYGSYLQNFDLATGKLHGVEDSRYWKIADFTDYTDREYTEFIGIDNATGTGEGNTFIQPSNNGYLRLGRNRIHMGWFNPDAQSDFSKINYKTFSINNTTTYWDSGIKAPESITDKVFYIRKSTSSTVRNQNPNIDTNWTFPFYIDGEGNLHAGDIYSNGQLISGTSAPYLLKTYESQTLTGALTITGNLEVNGTLTKGSKNVVYMTATPTTGQVVVTDGTVGGVKTTGYTIAKSVPSNALFTDANVAQTATTTNSAYELLFSGTADNTTRTEGARKTSTLTYNPSTKALVTGGTVNGYTLAAASAKGVDTSMTASSTSTNLPTTKAVADLIKTYLPLAGGTVSGETIFNDAVSVNDEFDADSITAGNLIVTGVGRFTNGIYGDLTGNVTGNVTGSLTGNATTATTAATATKVGNNLIIKLNSGTTEGTNMFTFNGSAAKTVDVTKSAIGLGNVENKSSATIRGELTSANVTTALGFTPYNSTNPNGYTTNTGTVTKVIAGTGLSIGTTAQGNFTTSGTINHTNSVTAKTAAAQSAKTLTWGGTFTIYEEKYDAQGHITGVASYNMTMPANPDTHYTASLITGASATAKANAAATNGNVYLNLVENSTVRNAHKITGSGSSSVTSDGTGNITISSPISLTGVSFSDGTITFNKSDGTSIPITTSDFVITQAAGATSLVRLKSGSTEEYEGYSAGGATTAPVYFDSNGQPVAVTSIPWTLISGQPSTYAVSVATSSTLGGVKIGYTTSGKNYAVQLSNEKMYVNVPWTDTTYSAGTGLSLSSTTFSLANNYGDTKNPYASKTAGYVLAAPSDSNGVPSFRLLSQKDIKPILSKTYDAYTISANDATNGNLFFGTVAITDTSTWPRPWGVKYRLTVTTTEANTQGTYDCEVWCNGSTLIYHNFNNFYSGDYRPIYHHGILYPKSGYSAQGAHLGVRIYSSRTPTTLARVIKVEILEMVGCTVTLKDALTTYGTLYDSAKYYYSEMNATSQGLQEYGDNDSTGYYILTNGFRMTAGVNKIYPYTLFARTGDGSYESFVLSSSTGTSKSKNTSGFLPEGKIYWNSGSGTYSSGIASFSAYEQYHSIDYRYSFNIGSTDIPASAQTYIKWTYNSTTGLLTLADSWLSTTLPTSDDGYIYQRIGSNFYGSADYRGSLLLNNPYYKYEDGALRVWNPHATVAMKAIADGSGNTITSTYLTKASGVTNVAYDSTNKKLTKTINGSTTDIVSVATLKTALSLVKGDVGLGNVDNTADANKRVKGANITTTANAVAYYTDTAGTFGTKASANGALYATAANGALSWGTLPVAQGGTGATTFTSGAALIGNGTSAIQTRSITNVTSGAVTASTNLVTANSLVAHVANKISAASDTYVTLTTTQTISGIKTFSNGAKFGTHWDISEDSTTNALVFKYVL